MIVYISIWLLGKLGGVGGSATAISKYFWNIFFLELGMINCHKECPLFIGASLSEPHTSGETGRIFYIYVSIYLSYVVLYIRDSRVLI